MARRLANGRGLVFALRVEAGPGFERLSGIRADEMLRRDLPIRRAQSNLLIDQRVVKPGLSGILASGGKVDSVRPRPIDGPEAHRARFATAVDGASGELMCAENFAGIPDGHNLGVGGRVVRRRHSVCTRGEGLAVPHDDRPERSTLVKVYAFGCDFDCQSQKGEMGGRVGHGLGRLDDIWTALSQWVAMPESLLRVVANYLIAIPLLAFVICFWLNPGSRRDFLLRGVVVLVSGFLLAKIGGALIDDPRPFVALHRSPLIPHEADNGFPSDHTLLGVSLALLILPVTRWLSLVALVAAILVGCARVACLIHSPLDIVGSIGMAVIANGIGLGVATIFSNRNKSTGSNLSSSKVSEQ